MVSIVFKEEDVKMRICVLTDNEFIFEQFMKIIKERKMVHQFDFFYSSFNKNFSEKYKDSKVFFPIRLKNEDDIFFKQYDLFFSLHSKQLFPDKLVENYRCINVHPGLNPYNRGWFPQVFSILNKLPVGVTIHEMDKELDHGPIIVQKEVSILSHETSYDVYRKIQQLEIELLKEYLDELLQGGYKKILPTCEGNINLKNDFDKLCKIDLEKTATFGEFIDLLRATTFGKYDNAYFYNEQGEKVYVSIELKVDKGSDL